MKKTLTSIAALAILATTSFSGVQTVDVDNSPGGIISEFIAQRSIWEAEGKMVRIGGNCASACNIFTGMENVCLKPNASDGTPTEILFHQGYELRAEEYVKMGIPIWYPGDSTKAMLKLMDPDLKAFAQANGLPTYESGEFLFIEYSDVIAKGYMKAC